MTRVIGGTIAGFVLSSGLVSLIGAIGLDEYDFYYDVTFPVILGAMCALIGGYLGSKSNQYYVKQIKIGRVMNKHAQYADKSMIVAIILLAFTLIMTLDVSGSYEGIGYVSLLAIAFLILAVFFAIQSIIEIRKTHEMGISHAITVIGTSAVLFIWWSGLLTIF